MSLPVTQHNDDFATAPQIQVDHVPSIAQNGFKTIINHRPDGEAGLTQPLSMDLAKAAEATGVHYHYLPVIRGQYTQAQIEHMAHLLEHSPKPIFSFCGSGMRASELYALAVEHVSKT